MMKRNHLVVVLNILIWCQNQQTTDTNSNRNQKTNSWVTCQSNTFDIFMYSIYCIEKVQKVQKDWKNECQKHESSIFFVPIFILLFIFPRFFIFIMWCSEVFSLLTSNEKKCRKSDSQKWTLISIKLQKITLFSLMYPMSCTYTMNGMNAVISYVCEWNSNINVQCSMFEIWYAWRASVNIKCNLFYWQFLPCHFARHWSIAFSVCNFLYGANLYFLRYYPKSNGVCVSKSFSLIHFIYSVHCTHKITVGMNAKLYADCWCYNFHALKFSWENHFNFATAV